jgi:membrane-bound metal-dependent hydrolase YbcI (DUF457 family)
MTPIGHSLAGYAIYNFSVAPTNGNRLKLAFLCIFMATAPDLDFLPGILIGKPTLYHHGITHSLGFALIASLLIAGIVSIRIKPFFGIFSLCFISYLSHIFIDFFEYSGNYNLSGMPLFWPISKEKHSSPVGLYLAFHYDRLPSASIIEWVKSMLNLYNLSVIVHEVVLILPFIFLGQLYKRIYRRDQLT